ncbi:hypothetical protein HHK36_027158 [Tetracentron sinense]|uniref:Uncharacterized protein n=1 Tax=Tetracentron sinense TaxID=13715 RepID=A0A835D3B0_TETSI|nr:hypothetical protein HHK36_027158 [Tetracentron sinense]
MDSQDHSKTHPPGHENHGVHLCHKCGWAFPNSHPSSKIRRAHKRVCGKIESEEKIHLSGSDEEQPSDEDIKTPEGPKMEDTMNNEKGSCEIQRKRSEEEIFSDAVTEFADTGTSPGAEMPVVEDTGRPDSNVERISEDDLETTQSLKATASAVNNSTHGDQLQNPQVLESSSHQMGSNALFQDHASISTIDSLVTSISDKGTESLAVELSNDRNGSASLLSPNKTETSVTASENTNTHTGENVTGSSMEFTGQNRDAKGKETTKIDGNLPDNGVSPSTIANEASEVDSKSPEMDGSAGVEISPDITNAYTRIITDTVPIDPISDSKEESFDVLGSKMYQNDPSDSCSRSTEIESVEHRGALVDTARVEVDAAREIDTPGDTVELFNVKEVNGNVHELSVPDYTPLEAHPEMMIEDFKDQGPGKSELSATHCGEEIRDLEDCIKNPVSEDTHAGFLLSKSGEGADVSSSAMQAPEDNLQLENRGSESMIEEVFVECEADISESRATVSEDLGLDELAAFPDATRSDIPFSETEKSRTVCSLEEQEPRDSCKILPENGTVVRAGEDVMISPVDAEVHQTTNVVSSDAPGINSTEGATKESAKLNTTASESASDPSASQFHANDGIIESERSQEIESTPPSKENAKINMTASESASDPSASQFQANDGIFESERLQEIESTPPSRENAKINISASESASDPSASQFQANDGIFESERLQEIESTPPSKENTKINTTASDSASDPSASQFHANDGIIESERLQEIEPTPLETVLDSSAIGISTDHFGNKTETHSSLQNVEGKDFQECAKELDITSGDLSSVSKKEVQIECVGDDSSATEPFHEETKLNQSSDVGLSQSGSVNLMLKEPNPSAVDAESGVLSSVVAGNGNANDSGVGASGIHSNSLQEEGDSNLIKQQVGASAFVHADVSVDSNSQTDSVEGYWGSVSDGTVPSTRYATDAPPILDAEALSPTDSQEPKEEAPKTNIQKTRGASKEHLSDKADIYEPPSFMTLVEPGRGDDRKAASDEIQTVENPQEPKSSLEAGWFPSLTNVVNESQGRKKNEEIIAKVVNWSAGKPHTPLKSLLVEANVESKPKVLNSQGHAISSTNKDVGSAKENIDQSKSFPPMPTPEVSTTAANRDTEREWNSPARLLDSKRDKKKVRGKPYWDLASKTTIGLGKEQGGLYYPLLLDPPLKRALIWSIEEQKIVKELQDGKRKSEDFASNPAQDSPTYETYGRAKRDEEGEPTIPIPAIQQEQWE